MEDVVLNYELLPVEPRFKKLFRMRVVHIKKLHKTFQKNLGLTFSSN